MQIHELNNYNKTLGANSFLAVDDGSDTGKISTQHLLADVESGLEKLDSDLNARIDNIIAGGEAPSASEIVDARLGVDNITYPSLGDAIRTQIKDVGTQISRIATSAFAQDDFRNVPGASILSGYMMTQNGPTEIRATANSLYTAVYLYAQYDIDIYFESADIHSVGYIDISMIENAQPIAESGSQYVISGTNAVYYRLSDNNLPTANDPLHVPKGGCVTITQGNISANFLIRSNISMELTPEVILNEVQLDQAKDYIGDEITTRFVNQTYRRVDFRSLDSVVALSNYNMGTNGSTQLRAVALSGYTACYLYPDSDFDLYFDPAEITNIGFIDISYIENAQPIEQSGSTYIVNGENAVYYRKSSSNLPTADNPLHVARGSCLSITEGTAAGNFLVHIDDVYELSPDIVLNQSQLSQVEDYIGMDPSDKSLKIKYNSSPESVEIYVPNVNGYIKYVFTHDVDQSINADIWRVDRAYHTDESLVQNYELTTSGEWELAVKLEGRPDFSGGAAHGDEVLTNIVFLVDGAPVDVSQFSAITNAREIYIIENSNLFDPNDGTTIFAEHGSVHIFNAEGLTIKQTLKYLQASNVVTAYMAMLPIAKSVSDMVVPNKDYAPVAANNLRLYDTTGATIYKSDGSVQAEFSVPVFEFFGSGFSFLCVDNGTTQYNKCYFCNTLDVLSVASGTVWRSETKYKFITGA